VELQQNLPNIRAQGLGVAAISYDAVPTLKDFAERRGITYPLLSDKDSAIIRKFGILNIEVPADSPYIGIPYPGTYIVDRSGRVLSKYFVEDYKQRYMTSEILVRQFGAAAGAARTASETKHLTVTAAASSDHVRQGQRIALTLDIQMKPQMHVYAPGVEGYIPIQWTVTQTASAVPHEPTFPKPTMLRLPVIGETLPVYSGSFRLVRDLTITNAANGPLTVEGTLKYQACDDQLCYIPQTVPLKWTLQVEPHDRERPPAELQRKMH
jgi:hypothetical protein